MSKRVDFLSHLIGRQRILGLDGRDQGPGSVTRSNSRLTDVMVQISTPGMADALEFGVNGRRNGLDG
ncbi:uncharacterized protein EAE98_011100 [Botrytis deweyae]|uniref:Uncharacterized protein n=1 Tax=Botrytis deweyae TaxID=2478750 RepID=A0ABQ7I6S9_9HELO|nr:uncharacterized protein EAE98_011100 [Botrytis deweyae]KAF7915497.1 hypothetical protein EAE98_011100 [Botrytis deweyae]KAF7921815.1 hypothetical protein EAE99_007578 [Botrytis elliptica]